MSCISNLKITVQNFAAYMDGPKKKISQRVKYLVCEKIYIFTSLLSLFGYLVISDSQKNKIIEQNILFSNIF